MQAVAHPAGKPTATMGRLSAPICLYVPAFVSVRGYVSVSLCACVCTALA